MSDIAGTCPVCGCDKPKVFVHGHYQCVDCKCVADGDCCSGETADPDEGEKDAMAYVRGATAPRP